LNENDWMKNFQGLLLALANTSEGKDLLCIDDHGLPIIGMKKNVVLYDHGDEYMADFRVGAKWANVIRYRWKEIRKALVRVNDISLSKRTQVSLRGQRLLVPAGAAQLTEYPDPHPETTTCDGQVHRDTTGSPESFSAQRNGNGTGVSDASANGYFQLYADTSSNTFFNLCRCIYGFDTSAIGYSTIGSSNTVSMVGNAGVNNLGTPDIALGGAAPASNTGLVAADFQTVTFTAFATALTYGSGWVNGTSTGAYNNFSLNTAGNNHIKMNGITWFSVMLSWDMANSFSGTWGSGQVTHQGSFMAEAGGTASDPKLVVNYTSIPFSRGATIF